MFIQIFSKQTTPVLLHFNTSSNNTEFLYNFDHDYCTRRQKWIWHYGCSVPSDTLLTLYLQGISALPASTALGPLTGSPGLSAATSSLSTPVPAAAAGAPQWPLPSSHTTIISWPMWMKGTCISLQALNTSNRHVCPHLAAIREHKAPASVWVQDPATPLDGCWPAGW